MSNKFTDENNKEYDEVFFDGYNVAERMLEGIMFKATYDDKLKKYIVDGVTDNRKTIINWDNDDYLCHLNEKKLMADAQDTIDSQNDCVEGPDGEDLYRDGD
jgi:7-keto-8-aminopelargonate synthetase-like enzyme